MGTFLLGERDVADVLSWDLCFEASDAAFDLGRGDQAIYRARGDLRNEGRFGALMLASGAEGHGLVTKTNVHAYGDGPARRTESVLILWNLLSGAPEAIVSARVFNDYRTAAGFVAGARRLLQDAPRTLLVVGTGKIGVPSIHAATHAFPSIKHVILRGRSLKRAWACAADLRGEIGNVEFSAVEGRARDHEADLVFTATTSAEPVLAGAALRKGATIVLGGANRPGAREADDDLMARAGRIACDSVEGALQKAGDIILALKSGALSSAEHLVPLPSWNAKDSGDFRVFKSIGVGEQDLVLARALVARAKERGVGRMLDLEAAATVQDRTEAS